VGLFSLKRRPNDVGKGGGPVADATIEHPPQFEYRTWSPNLPGPLAPDPGGLLARMATGIFPVMSTVPQQRSPQTNWLPGRPLVVDVAIDFDSIRWWGRGPGQMVWSNHTEEISANLPAALPELVQHYDVWQRFWGGYPSLARNRPPTFGDQVPLLNPLR
jgi:hypothetical protein